MQYRTVTLRWVVHALTLIVLVGGPAGCARQPCTVSGRVAFQGQPVTGGSVVLYGEGQQIVRGTIGPDGTYSIPNAPRGHVRIAVAPPIRLPAGMRKKYTTPPVIDGPVIPDSTPPAKDSRALAIPARYGVPEESGLTITVDRSVTEFDINLTR